MAKKRTPKPAPFPVTCSFSITETGPTANTYNTQVDSSANVPTEGDFILHMGRAIGQHAQEFAMWEKIMAFAKDVNYERTYNITGSH